MEETKPRRPKGTGTMTERPAGSGVWRLRAFVDTDPTTKRPRQVSRTVRGTRTQAQKALTDLIKEVQDGRHSVLAGSVAHLMDEYIRQLRARGRAESTLEKYESTIERRIKPALGAKMVNRLTAKDLDDLYARALADGMKASSIESSLHALISGALTQAVKWDWIPYSVAPKASPPTPAKALVKAPTPEEFATLAAAAFTGVEADHLVDVGKKWGRYVKRKWEPDPDLGMAILLYALTGARRGELVGLRWSDIDWAGDGILAIDRQWLKVRGRWQLLPPKRSQFRKISLGPRGLELLRRWELVMKERTAHFGQSWDPGGWILSPDGGHSWYRPNYIGASITALSRRLGIEGVHTHALRHFSASELTAAGFDPRTVAERHGHARPSITLDTYSHFRPQRDQAAAAHMGGFLPAELPSLTDGGALVRPRHPRSS